MTRSLSDKIRKRRKEERAVKRGRKEGQNVNSRDERGWMIPREGTKRREIYDLMVAGKTDEEICSQAQVSMEKLRSHRHCIKHADYVNARDLAVKRRHEAEEASWLH